MDSEVEQSRFDEYGTINLSQHIYWLTPEVQLTISTFDNRWFKDYEARKGKGFKQYLARNTKSTVTKQPQERYHARKRTQRRFRFWCALV